MLSGTSSALRLGVMIALAVGSHSASAQDAIVGGVVVADDTTLRATTDAN